ncbi:MAG: ribosome small subunit-dependent GTPase A [Acidobacteriota bacterium]
MKRSRGAAKAQLDQRLSKQARELHGEGLTDHWDTGLEEAAQGPPKRRRKTSEPGPGQDPAPAEAGPWRQGTVVSVASGQCWLRTGDGAEHRCVFPSHIAKDQKAAVAVGDQARFLRHGDDFRLLDVLDRRTYLARPHPLNPRIQRVVAANMDVVVIVVSVARPALHPALVDRYLIAIQQGGAEPVLAVNKIDLLPECEVRRELTRLDDYVAAGSEVLPCSADTGAGVDALRRRLAGKTAVFVGHSGVGKSSLVNALDPAAAAATGAVNHVVGTGRHTTTRSSLYDVGGGIQLIDTPGIRELGLWKVTAENLGPYFPEFEPYAAACRFRDCTHSHEPGCAVREAAANDDLPAARYATYLRILESLEEVR